MNGMLGMIKNMDNDTIKSMMQMQGMTLSDEQINMMKGSMNPEMMNMMKNMKGGMPQPNLNQNQNLNNNMSNRGSNIENEVSPSRSSNSNSGNNSLNNSNMPNMNGGFPDMSNMGDMLKMVQNNPQLMNMMGPQMSKMFGGDGTNPGQNETMMNAMQNVMWVISLPQRIKAFFKSPKGMLFLLFVIVLIVSYFYR